MGFAYDPVSLFLPELFRYLEKCPFPISAISINPLSSKASAKIVLFPSLATTPGVKT